MGNVNERVATQRSKYVGGNATTGPSGAAPSISAEGEDILAARDKPVDYTLKPADIQNQMDRHNASLAAEAQALRDNESFGSLDEARKAAALLKENADVWEQDRLDRGWKRVRNFVSQNPEAVAQFQADKEKNDWEEKYMDTSPAQSSRLINSQRDTMRLRASTDDTAAGTRFMNDMLPIPQSREDLAKVPADSREGVIDQLEQEGVDTVSGIGGFWDNVGLAIKLNNSSAQAAAVLGMAMDNIEDAGIPLRPGLVPISVNEDLGMLEVLKPTEDGKLRRTLVEPEVMGLAGLGQLADLEELMAGIYAGTAALRGGGTAGKHPFLREAIGDYAGRNVGIMLEAAISTISNEAELDDIVQAFGFRGNISESLLNTAVSRGMARTGRVISGAADSHAAKYARGSETEGVIANNIDEAADTLEAVNALVEGSDNVLPYTVEAGSLSEQGAQRINARASTLTPGKADAVELQRRERIKTLGEANRRVAEKHSPADSLEYDAHTITEEATGTVNTARQRAAEATRRKYTQNEGILVTPSPVHGEDAVRYTLRGETDKTTQGAGELAGEHGVSVIFGDDTVHIVDFFAGDKFEGATSKLLFQVLDDAGDRTLTFGDSVSQSAQKMVAGMQRRGFDIEVHPGAKTDGSGNLVAPNLEPVYTLVSRPGEISAPRLVADADFDRAVVEAGLEGVEDLLPVAQMRADDANTQLKQTIGWSEQKQASDFYIQNKPQSGLNQLVRKLQNRIGAVLSGAEQREAESKLALLVRRDIDEEGNTVLSGLVNNELDIGNLINSRAKLNEIAKETSDPDVIRAVETIDNLINNQPYINRTTGRARPTARASVHESIDRARSAQADMTELVGVTNSSKMFKRNADGQFINTDLQSMGRVLGNNSAFMQNMAPVLERGPDLQDPVRQALGELYRTNVLERAGGWSGTAHRRFLEKYSTAIDAVFPGEEKALLTSFQPPKNLGMSRFDAAREAANRKWTRLVKKYAPDAETVSFSNPKDIVASVNNMGAARARGFMGELDKLNPQLAESVRATSIEQTRNQLNKRFFDTTRPESQLQTGPALRAWFDESKDSLRALHGAQYVTDLDTIVRASELDAKRKVVRGHTPPTQHDMIRVTRSLLGPLSKPQRQITAGNYLNNKRLAAKVLDIYSDPDMLRSLKQSKGLGARSEAGIALGLRIGLFEAAGIPSPTNPNDPSSWEPEFIQEVNALYDEIDFVAAEIEGE